MGPYLAALLNARERLGPLVFISAHGQVGNLRYSLESITKSSLYRLATRPANWPHARRPVHLPTC